MGEFKFNKTFNRITVTRTLIFQAITNIAEDASDVRNKGLADINHWFFDTINERSRNCICQAIKESFDVCFLYEYRLSEEEFRSLLDDGYKLKLSDVEAAARGVLRGYWAARMW